jgi:hypothetical protein
MNQEDIIMIGVRKDRPDGSWFLPGEYGKCSDSSWMCCPFETTNDPHIPYYHGNLSNHGVIEHDDGTITVSPSILITRHDGQWHGYLVRGVWSLC